MVYLYNLLAYPCQESSINNQNQHKMRFYPIKSNFFDPEDYVFQVNDGRSGLTRFTGDFGLMEMECMDGRFTIDRVYFDFHHPTWLFYKFSTSHSFIIYAVDHISFEIKEKKYNICPGTLLHISGYSSPEFLLFPAGQYQFYLISATAVDRDMGLIRLGHFDRIKKEIKTIIARENNKKN